MRVQRATGVLHPVVLFSLDGGIVRALAWTELSWSRRNEDGGVVLAERDAVVH